MRGVDGKVLIQPVDGAVDLNSELGGSGNVTSLIMKSCDADLINGHL